MGGCASKQTDDQEAPEYMGKASEETGPFSTLFELHKGICTVSCEQDSGLGFLCRFPLESDPQQYVHGLVTTNYTLGVAGLKSGELALSFDSNAGGQKRSYSLNVNPQQRFRFTCPILDATFLCLTNEEVLNLRSRKRLFLELSTDWEGIRKQEVMLIQQQVGFKTRFANGVFLRYHGINILHTSSGDVGSWGSPLALKDGKIIGLHKRKRSGGQFDVALSTKVLVGVLQKLCRSTEPPAKLVSNPIRFNPDSELRVVEHGLAKCDVLDNKILIFQSPSGQPEDNGDEIEVDEEGFARDKPPPSQEDEVEKIDTTTYVSPIWFAPTSHGWFWTPTDPYDRSQETNWMPITTRYVTGSIHQHGKKMLNKDVVIARWLKSTGGIQRN